MTSPVYTASMQARAATLLETAQTWTRATRKRDGLAFVIFGSSIPGTSYSTALRGCTCRSYLYRGACSHHLAVTLEAEAAREAAAVGPCARYEDLFQGSGFDLTDAF